MTHPLDFDFIYGFVDVKKLVTALVVFPITFGGSVPEVWECKRSHAAQWIPDKDTSACERINQSFNSTTCGTTFNIYTVCHH